MRYIQKSAFLLIQIFVFSLIFTSAQTLSKADLALLEACEHNNQKAAKAALKAGANINAQNDIGVTPLNFAVMYNDPQFIDLLLQAGAKVIIQSDYGTNALDILRPSSNGIKEKLEAAMAKDKALAEQFMQAVLEDKTDKALELLQEGAYLDFADNRLPEHLNALMVAVDRNNIELVKALLKAGARLERADKNGLTALFYANSWEILKLLIDAGADVNARRKYGINPIMGAARDRDSIIVQSLIDAGANVNSEDLGGNSPLFYATASGKIEMIKFLLSKNADVNKENKDHKNLLHYAIENGHPEVVPILLKSGVDPNKKSYKGYTPLMIAARNGDLTAMNLLLENGADSSLTNDDGETALMVAQREKKTEIAATLTKSTKTQSANSIVSEMKKEINSDQVKILFTAVSVKNNFGQVLGLLENGFSPNLKNEKGETPLMIATDNEDGLMINLLLRFSADINAQDNEGMTALMRSVAKDLFLSTPTLLNKGAKKDIQDKKGRTALKIAEEVKGTVWTLYQKQLEN